jgi:hypothetical protein
MDLNEVYGWFKELLEIDMFLLIFFPFRFDFFLLLFEFDTGNYINLDFNHSILFYSWCNQLFLTLGPNWLLGSKKIKAIHVRGPSLTFSHILQVNQAIAGVHGVDVQFAGIKFLEALVCNTSFYFMKFCHFLLLLQL